MPKILVIDDSRMMRLYLRRVLGKPILHEALVEAVAEALRPVAAEG